MTPAGNLVAKTSGVRAERTAPWWLWLSVPIATLAIAASLSGIFVDSVYS